MKPSRVRIEDVARQAGVSPTAVSFAFNNPSRLNPQTVQRILDAAQQLGYAPNPHARALLAKSVGVIGILTPQSLSSVFSNPFFAAFHEGVGRVCEEHRLSLLTLSPVAGSLTEAIHKVPVDGLIVVGLNENHEEIELLRRRRIPFVIVDGDARETVSVNVDDEQGAWQAADFLLRRGHCRIACLTFETDYDTSHPQVYGVGQRRLEGYERAFTDHGLDWDDGWLLPTPISVPGGAQIFQALWAREERPTAVLAVADVIAMGVLLAAAQLGVRVPADLAVIGYDDIAQAVWTHPPLTTVHQPIAEKGELAAQILLGLIAGEVPRVRHILLPTELMIRQSA